MLDLGKSQGAVDEEHNDGHKDGGGVTVVHAGGYPWTDAGHSLWLGHEEK